MTDILCRKRKLADSFIPCHEMIHTLRERKLLLGEHILLLRAVLTEKGVKT